MRRKIISVFFIFLTFGTTLSPCFYADPITEQTQLMESSDVVLENHNCFVLTKFSSNNLIFRGGYYPIIGPIREFAYRIFFEMLNLCETSDYSGPLFRIACLISVVSIVWMWQIKPQIGNIRPLAIKEDVYFSHVLWRYNSALPSYEPTYHPCKGKIWTIGNDGFAEYEGKMVGKLKNIEERLAFMDYQDIFLGAENFTGIHTSNYMIGRCSHIKLKSNFY